MKKSYLEAHLSTLLSHTCLPQLFERKITPKHELGKDLGERLWIRTYAQV